MIDNNPYMPAITGLENTLTDPMPTRPGKKELLDLIDLDVLQRTCDALGRDLDQAQSKIATALNILRQMEEMQMTHAQRNTINELLIKLLEKPALPPWDGNEIPF